MSELLISAAPTPTPNGAGSANALSQGDATARTGGGAQAEREGSDAPPFAAVLKSRMDQATAAADGTENAGQVAATPSGEDEIAYAGLDLSALLPLLAGGQMAVASMQADSVARGEPDPAQTLISSLLAPAEQGPIAILAALPAAAAPTLPTDDAHGLPPATTAATATMAAGASADASTGVTATASAVPLLSAEARIAKPAAAQLSPTVAKADTATGLQGNSARNDGAGAATPAISAETARASGKNAPDTAINADAGRRGGEQAAAEAPAGDFRALLERAATVTPGAASQPGGSSSGPSLRVDTPLGQTGWHDEVGQRLTWMVGNNRQQADLVLNPPQLGRIEVSLTMNGDQASAIFTSANPAVREALENSLHRLREVLADAGVSLGQTQVGSESPNQPWRRGEPDLIRDESMGYAASVPLATAPTAARAGAGRSMIDIFA